MRVLLTMLYNNIVIHTIPTLYGGYIVSVHRMVMENRPVDPGSTQGSHRPISLIRIKHKTCTNDLSCVPYQVIFYFCETEYSSPYRRFSSQKPYFSSIINEIQNKHVQRTCLMFLAACKVELQPFNRSYSQLTFFNFL